MAGSRTLKLSILADVDDLKKNLAKGTDEVQTFGSKIADFGKKAGIAFAIAGAAAVAYAGKLAIDGVKSAIADAAAQEKLAITLKNVTGATDAQIKATESYITQTSLQNDPGTPRTALGAMQTVAQSEYGAIYVGFDGSFVFKDRLTATETIGNTPTT